MTDLIFFSDRLKDVAMVTNYFGAKSEKMCHTPPSFVALAFLNEMEDRYDDAHNKSGDNLST